MLASYLVLDAWHQRAILERLFRKALTPRFRSPGHLFLT